MRQALSTIRVFTPESPRSGKFPNAHAHSTSMLRLYTAPGKVAVQSGTMPYQGS